ncbi:MAG: hypothetical protein ABUU24_06275, partial [Variovorax sp.]
MAAGAGHAAAQVEAGRRILEGVAQHVAQRPREQAAVRDAQRLVQRADQQHANVALARVRPGIVDGLLQQRDEVEHV